MGADRGALSHRVQAVQLAPGPWLPDDRAGTGKQPLPLDTPLTAPLFGEGFLFSRKLVFPNQKKEV